uniref:Semaphorin-1A n=1 Tax=Panagrolaimus superbus TaxID=310955 RepID=A0A914Y5F6_9BILA
MCESIISGQADFALNLIREIGANESAVISPISISFALGMTLLGAKGNTAKEIQDSIAKESISEPIPQSDGDAIVYAVFSTSRSAVLMNAVCAFKMSAIDRVFNHGNFKTQRSVSSYSNQKSQNFRGNERPGKCPKDSRSLGDISFILKNPLMSDLINAIDQPLLVEGPSKPDLTKIIAIGGVKAVERNQTYDIMYVGRNDGKVIKLIKAPQGDSVVIESVAVFDNPPTGIQALRPLFESNEMVVVGSDRVAKIPLFHCDKQTSCSRCVALRDPHCAWDTENLVCIHSNDWNFGSFVQNIVKGMSSQCPESVGDIEGYAINAAPAMDSTKEFRQLLDEAEDDGFSVTTIAMIIICAVLMATGLGFLIGYRISKWRFLSEIQTAHSSGFIFNGTNGPKNV